MNEMNKELTIYGLIERKKKRTKTEKGFESMSSKECFSTSLSATEQIIRAKNSPSE